MAWITIANSEIDQDSPITQTLMTALRDNVPAALNGDSGAPRLQVAALQEVAAGGSIKLRNDGTASTTSLSYQGVIDFNIMQAGTIRAEVRHRAPGSGSSDVRVLRNATEINSWSTSSSSFVSRSVDFSVSPGDRIRIQYRAQGLSGAESEVDNRRFSTNGAYILPFNTTSFTEIST